MTDPDDREPPGPGEPEAAADGLASAYLDGSVGAGEASRVEGDPALSQRVTEFAALAGRLATVPAPPAAALDGAVSAALAAYDRERAAPDAVPATARTAAAPAAAAAAPGTSRPASAPPAVAARRPRRLLAGLAAAVLAVGGLAAVLLATGGGGPSTLADSAARTPERSVGAAGAPTTTAAGGAAADTGSANTGSANTGSAEARPVTPLAAPTGTEQLGSFEDADALVAHIRSLPLGSEDDASTASGAPTATSTSPPSTSCPPPDGNRTIGEATVAGRQLLVTVTTDPSRPRVAAYDATSCALVVDEPLHN